MVLAFLLRFEYSLPREAAPVLSMAVWLAVVVKLPVFMLRRRDRGDGGTRGWWICGGCWGRTCWRRRRWREWRYGGWGWGSRGRFWGSIFCCVFWRRRGCAFSVRLYRRGLAREWQARGPAKGVLIYGAGRGGFGDCQGDWVESIALGYQVVGLAR
jgi:hypothetical protein